VSIDPNDIIPVADLARVPAGASDDLVGVQNGTARRFSLATLPVNPRTEAAIAAQRSDIDAIRASQGSGLPSYAPRTDLPAPGTLPRPAGGGDPLVTVTNDPVPANLGAWRDTGSEWVKSEDRSSALEVRIDAVEPKMFPDLGSAWLQTTEDGHRLPLGYRADGKLDAFARKRWLQDVNDSEEVPRHPVYSMVRVDEQARIIYAERWDGGVEIPGLQAQGGGVQPTIGPFTDAAVPLGSDLTPLASDRMRVVGWGSSSVSQMAEGLTAIFAEWGVEYFNQAKGGEQFQQALARQGSRPALLIFPGGTIPASGAVNVASPTLPVRDQLQPYSGVVSGVHGTLSSTDTTLVFERTEAGAAVQSPPNSAFAPDGQEDFRRMTMILQIGKNNGGIASTTAAQNAAFDFASPLVKRALVINNYPNGDSSDGVRDAWIARNAEAAARYGDMVVDLFGWLMGPQVWADTGITPTPTDLDVQASGRIAPSLRSDPAHMSAATTAAFLQYVLRPKLVQLYGYPT